ncbi:hypothetical protein DSECCO2_541830 [anaerobic digester metagenome]
MSPLIQAMSVPGAWRSQTWACRVRPTARGSATTSFAPARTARLTRAAKTGWVSVVLEPVTRMTSALAMSSMGLVAAPLPKACIRPVTVGAWHSRAQWSTLLVPISLASFWKR